MPRPKREENNCSLLSYFYFIPSVCFLRKKGDFENETAAAASKYTRSQRLLPFYAAEMQLVTVDAAGRWRRWRQLGERRKLAISYHQFTTDASDTMEVC
ncbi:unnamed protein product [Linum trigynum]|uniref:Uncharacterized protein n=1 Tax=Linum trigynum TaxID=586398 RepID=A0AAV2GNL8_9ROSI